MFGWLRRKADKDPHAYKGDGIFVQCPSCEGYHPAQPDAEYERAIKDACAEISASTDLLYEKFNIGDPEGRWDMLPDTGTFTFTNANGQRCFAQFSLVGSWVEHTHSWMWGWNLPDTHITDATRKAPDLARALGRNKDWPCLTAPMLLLDADEAWHLTKFAASLASHPMVYRAKVNDKAWAFFAIDAPVWES